MSYNVQPYLMLIEKFISKEIDSASFQEHYLRMFKDEQAFFPQRIYDLLNLIFISCDEFTNDDQEEVLGSLSEDQFYLGINNYKLELEELVTAL